MNRILALLLFGMGGVASLSPGASYADVPPSANAMIVARRVPISAPTSVQAISGVPRYPAEVRAARGMNGVLAAGSNRWHWALIAEMPAVTVLHDLIFTSEDVGYVVAEHGLVLKTGDSGRHWTPVLLSDYSDYWYGVDATSADDIVVSGFHAGVDPETQTPVNRALVRWSRNAGQTWSDPIVLREGDWAFRVRFPDAGHGVALGQNLSLIDSPAFITANGGELLKDWGRVVTGNSGWFGQQFSAHANGRVRASGISYCQSADFGAMWTCGPGIDPVFDGATFFIDELNGWVAGGSISPTEEGWVHKTIDDGANWSDRTLQAPWPIRELLFIDRETGWAVGGNAFGGVGGIYSTVDGGDNWSLDVDTGFEMSACERSGTKIYCVGYDGAFNGKVYRLDLDTILADGFDNPHQINK